MAQWSEYDVLAFVWGVGALVTGVWAAAAVMERVVRAWPWAGRMLRR